MTLKFSYAVTAAMLTAISTTVGNSGATLVIYNGTRPASISTAITDQVPLVTIDLTTFTGGRTGDDAHGGVNNPITALATANGTASFFRIMDSSSNVVIEGDVTDAEGSGDLIVSTVDLKLGYYVRLLSMLFNVPSIQNQ